MMRRVVIVVLVFLVTSLTASAQDAQATAAPTQAVAQAAASQTEAAAKPSSQPTFGLDRLPALRYEALGYPLWQYVASLIWVVLAFLLATVADWLMTHQIRRLTAKTKTDLDDRLLEILRTPVKIAVIVLMLHAGTNVFAWPDWAEKILRVLFVIAVTGIAVYVALQLVDLLVEYAERRFFAGDTHLAKLMVPVLSKSLKVFIIIISSLTAAQFLGLPIASVIAGLGIGGVAVALAAQNTLANVFGTITILADRPFKVGDRIQVDKYDGIVETIGLRSTRIRTLEGHLVTLPNKVVVDSGIDNVSMRPNIRQLITISLTYDTTHERMQEAIDTLRDIFLKHPLTHDAWIYWKDYAAASLDIFIVYWCKSTNYKEFLQTLEELNLEIKRRFDAAGLDFAFPTQTIHLLQDTAPSVVK